MSTNTLGRENLISKDMVFLVVDDFEPMVKVVSGQLRALGARTIVTAANGAEALRMLQRHRIDLILSDWNMPVMTGLELLKAVRSDKTLSHLPFIMITAEAERHHVEEAIANGVSDLLVKPYTADYFAARVEKALTSRPRKNSAVRATREEPTETAEPLVSGTPVRPTLLIVDDAPDNLQLLAEIFKDEYNVQVARSGEAALGLCQSDNPPDMVLLDIMMPGMDGFEVARRMREHPTSETIPVIFVTAMTGADAHIKGLDLGAVDFINKPVDPDVLKPRVRNFMRYVKLHKQLQATYDGMMELARLREEAENTTRHDIKGSLSGVIGLVQALEEDGSMNNKQVRQLRMVEETATQVLDMVNLSSELFRLETGGFKLDPKPVGIGNILRSLVESSRMTFEEKHLSIVVDTDVPLGVELPQVLGNAMFCQSLFQNLIKNACEAAPEKSRVYVTLYDETPLRITIQNKGAVPAEIREHFFDKFATYGKPGGSGLGTYSAKLLTEAQNGTISLEVSDYENKTTLTVILPRYSEAASLKALRAL